MQMNRGCMCGWVGGGVDGGIESSMASQDIIVIMST